MGTPTRIDPSRLRGVRPDAVDPAGPTRRRSAGTAHRVPAARAMAAVTADGGQPMRSKVGGLVLLGVVEAGIALLRKTSYRQVVDSVVRSVVAAAAIRTATKSYNAAAGEVLLAIEQRRARR